MMLDIVIPTIELHPSGPGVEGHGEGISYNGKSYYYRDGKRIPKNKVASLMWEGNWCGRVHGDKEYIFVAWNGKSFTVLSHEYSYIRKYNKMLPEDAILLKERELKRIEEDIARMPKCKKCGSIAYVFEEDQKNNECLTCYSKRIKDK